MDVRNDEEHPPMFVVIPSEGITKDWLEGAIHDAAVMENMRDFECVVMEVR